MTIIRRGDRYGVKIHTGGKQKWIGTFTTLREAKRAEAEAVLAPVDTSGATIEDYAWEWLEGHCAGKEFATRRQYAESVKAFTARFGDLRMEDFTREMARRWALEVSQTRRAPIRTMFGIAEEDGVVARNPFSNLRIAQSRGRKDTIPFRTDDPTERVARLDRLANTATLIHGDYRFDSMILFAAYTGMRPGELFALEWDDIDVERNLVHVTKAHDRVGGVKKPKSGKDRTIALPPPAAEALARVRPTLDAPHVWLTKTGKCFRQPTLSTYWTPVRNAAGFPGKDFYELRHFCATHLLERGLAAEDVAHQLGHTDGGRLVMSTYGHPSVSASRARVYAAFAS